MKNIWKDFAGVYIFHNQPKAIAGYTATVAQLFPLNEWWKQRFLELTWPSMLIPKIADRSTDTLLALIHEYFFQPFSKHVQNL